jgi:hypothetical protein
MTMLTIFVPKAGSAAGHMVIPGSAIVATPKREIDGRAVCYYEGGRHIETYFEKLKIAAGRLMTRYPTIALAAFDLKELVQVGTYDGDRYVVTEITNAATLQEWSGETSDQIMGLRLNPGPISWDDAVALARPPHSSPIGPSTPRRDGSVLYKTQAGQIIACNVLRKSAEVYEHDDPSLPHLLDRLHLREDQIGYILGKNPSSGQMPQPRP